jgi:holo-[acyl-carrier protein] synthase
MIVATGIDIIEISRIESVLDRYGERFLDRIFTPEEKLQIRNIPEDTAVRFAAKEAASKALGTGISGGIRWKDLEITSLPSGKPVLNLSGKAEKRAEMLGWKNWSVSLSHSREMAVAVVTAVG